MGNALAIRILEAYEKLVLENAALRAYLEKFHPKSPWEAHLELMQNDPNVNAAIRDRFAALRSEAQDADSASMGLQQLLKVFPANKDWN